MTISKMNSDDGPEFSINDSSYGESFTLPNQSSAEKDSVLNLIREITEDTRKLSPELLDELEEIAEEDMLSGMSSYEDPSSKTTTMKPNKISILNLGIQIQQQKTMDKQPKKRNSRNKILPMKTPEIDEQGIADKFDCQKPGKMNQNTGTEVNSIGSIVPQEFPRPNYISQLEELPRLRNLASKSIRSGRSRSPQTSERFLAIPPLESIDQESLNLGSPSEEMGVIKYGPRSRISEKMKINENKNQRSDPKSSIDQVPNW